MTTRPPKKRTRRTPEEARAHILEAALRVFRERLPDQTGLVDIAREAGVSHALVTHYFGTYEKLVEACLAHRFVEIRTAVVEELQEAPPDVRGMLGRYRRALRAAAGDPATVRLVVWAALSGRADADDFFPHHQQGLRLLTDALEQFYGGQREDLEFCVIASFALSLVSHFGGRAMTGALGRKAARDLDATFEERIADMIDAYLARA